MTEVHLQCLWQILVKRDEILAVEQYKLLSFVFATLISPQKVSKRVHVVVVNFLNSFILAFLLYMT